jgi:hypothetical protein
MREVQLTQGYVALVDDEDYERVSQYTWRAERRSNGVRAYTHIKWVKIYLHRFVLNIVDPSVEVDHENHDQLDNQKHNLKAVTHKQNSENKRSKRSNTGVRGVRRLPSGNFAVYVNHNGWSHHFGTYGTIEEAERVAIAARQKLFTHSND